NVHELFQLATKTPWKVIHNYPDYLSHGLSRKNHPSPHTGVGACTHRTTSHLDPVDSSTKPSLLVRMMGTSKKNHLVNGLVLQLILIQHHDSPYRNIRRASQMPLYASEHYPTFQSSPQSNLRRTSLHTSTFQLDQYHCQHCW